MGTRVEQSGELVPRAGGAGRCHLEDMADSLHRLSPTVEDLQLIIPRGNRTLLLQREFRIILIATGLCSTCPRRDVRGRFLTGWVRSSRESPRTAAPAMAATAEGKDRRGDYQGTLADASSFPDPRAGLLAGVAGTGRRESAGGGHGP